MRSRNLGVLALGLLGVWASTPVAMAHQGKGRDFSLTGRFTDYQRTDRGGPGWVEGDEISFRFDLFHHQEQAGDGDGLCTITRYDRQTRGFTAACTGIFNLDAGTLDLAGEVTDEAFRTQEIILDVVGGSERFKNAKGVAAFSRTGPAGPPADHPGDSKQHPNRHRDFRVDVNLA